jgi:hypothetical protein
MSKTKLNEGDTLTLTYEAGKWRMDYRGVRAPDSPSGSFWPNRHSPYPSLDEAITAFKDTFDA